jgi:3-deoxy-D-arabino-heptulosonate 7-phosphate (DAHP) synthase
VYPDPETALSDGPQSQTFEMFGDLMARIRRLTSALDRNLATAPSHEMSGSPI